MSRAFSIPASIACALISLAYPAPGQTDIVLSGGLNFPSMNFEHDSPPWPLAQFWDPGYSIAASVETHLSRAIAFVPSFEYARYPWRDMTTPGWAPTYLQPMGAGEPSRLYRMSVAARLYVFSTERLGVFLSTGAGYVIEKLGPYRLAPWNDVAFVGDLSGIVQYPDRYYWVHAVSGGAHFLISGDVGLDIAGEYFSNYTDRFHTSLILGVFYRIAEQR